MDKRFGKYYVWIVVGLSVFIICALSRELFAGLPVDETFAVLSDCFFVPGVLLAGVGGLSWISSIGGYDIIGYGGTTLKSHFVRIKEQPESYYEYKQRKSKQRGKWLREALFTGLGFSVIAVICTVCYYIAL